MRVGPIIAVLALVFAASAASAQDWIEYVSAQDRFRVNFPGQPNIENVMHETECAAIMTGHRYTAERGLSGYTMTVIDFSKTTTRPAAIGLEKRGAMQHLATQIRQKRTVTYDAYAEIQVVPGHQLQVTLPNGRRLFAEIHFLDNRLYVMEAEVPGNAAPPAAYQASLELIDNAGMVLRYREDNHSFPDGRPRQR
jgi:hypothetical protein